MDQEMIDGKPYTWVGAFVYSHEKDENVFVGALRFKGEKLVLDRKVANFVEVYGRRRPVADIPKVTVTFGPPVVNGTAAKNPHGRGGLPEGRAGLRRRRGEGRFTGHHRGPAGRGPRTKRQVTLIERQEIAESEDRTSVNYFESNRISRRRASDQPQATDKLALFANGQAGFQEVFARLKNLVVERVS